MLAPSRQERPEVGICGYHDAVFPPRAVEDLRIGSEVIVALSASHERARVTVTDSGPGIDPAERERIFDRFYTKKPAGGSPTGAGLGLAIARAITRDHQGELTIGDGWGPGATFELTLPLEDGAPEPRTIPSQQRDYAAGRRTTNRAPASLG